MIKIKNNIYFENLNLSMIFLIESANIMAFRSDYFWYLLVFLTNDFLVWTLDSLKGR